jgi:hypothetical protein
MWYDLTTGGSEIHAARSRPRKLPRMEVEVIGWLPAIAFYWTFAALYLGGAAIEIEGGGGGRQLIGLLLHFVVFLVVFGLARALFGVGLPDPLAVGLGLVVGVASFAMTAKLTFLVVGVRIKPSGTIVHELSASLH